MSNAFCTARNPLALETATGFAAHRLGGGSGCGGRIGKGISRARAAATPTAAEARNSRRDSSSDTERTPGEMRSEEHTSELQSRLHLVCRLLLEKKKKNIITKKFTCD